MISKIKNIIREILLYLNEMESKSTENYLYWTNVECDSNVTLFEGLSNENRLVLYSNLKPIYIRIILSLFQNIFDDNYNIFDRKDLALFDYLDNVDDELLHKNNISLNIHENKDIDLLYSHSDFHIWLKYLTIINSDLEDDSDIHIKNEYVNMMWYHSIPIIEDYRLKKEYKDKYLQQIFTIKSIIDLIN